MRSSFSFAAIAATFFVSASGALAQGTESPPAPVRERTTDEKGATEKPDSAILRSHLGTLRDRLRQGIEQKEPSANFWIQSGHSTVFDGSYDWHSCIAAHWALLSMSRTLRDAETAKWTLDRLPAAALQQELQLLATAEEASASSGSTARAAGTGALFRPYADAWLLLLLDELTRHESVDRKAIAQLRNEAEAALLTRLEVSPFPELAPSAAAPEGKFAGDYRSWLFGYLATQLVTPGSDAAKARRDALRTTKLEPVRARLQEGPARGPRDFLDLGALLRVIDAREGRAAARVAEPTWTQLPDALPKISEVHPIGAAVSETWPLAALANRAPSAQKAFDARMATILQREDLWSSDFAIASHWLPQFLWFGMWLSSETAPAVAAATDASLKPKPKRVLLPAPGTPAPEFAMTDRAGNPVSLAQFRGKVVVLDFWATWCGPCKAAMPHLQELAKHYANQGVVVLASCTNDERAKFDAWVDEHQDEYADIHFAYDPLGKGDDRASMALYGVMMIPTTIVLDREGKVAKAVGGYVAGEVLVDAALTKAGITVSKEVLEQAERDEQKRKERSGPARVPATGKKKPEDKAPAPADAGGTNGGK